ncbi:MAG: uracil-DNA glycosylase [Methanomicrobiales archaeon]|nr:uracil-DNA glycosylase [Methanomicrobiales archaeon]
MDREQERHLRWEITHCTKCDLHRSRTHAVPGEGPPDARVFLIGEGPGREEDQKGLPFVGRAGSVLDGLLESICLDRKQVFITSVVKCHPPGNRAPTREESRTCRQYLGRQLALIDPEVLVPMGHWATWDLFELFGTADRPIGEVHGKTLAITIDGEERIVHPTYHPAVITHNPNMRRSLEQDFLMLGEVIRDLER